MAVKQAPRSPIGRPSMGPEEVPTPEQLHGKAWLRGDPHSKYRFMRSGTLWGRAMGRGWPRGAEGRALRRLGWRRQQCTSLLPCLTNFCNTHCMQGARHRSVVLDLGSRTTSLLPPAASCCSALLQPAPASLRRPPLLLPNTSRSTSLLLRCRPLRRHLPLLQPGQRRAGGYQGPGQDPSRV
jgi:hypothetical protein